jgi:hypothetical protein
MIQYSDCLVDTTAEIFFEEARRKVLDIENGDSMKVQKFIEYVHEITAMPRYGKAFNEKDYSIYLQEYKLWESLRMSRIDSVRRTNGRFDKLLTEAISAGMHGWPREEYYDEFEEYVEVYYSKKMALEMKRKRMVMGTCSQDSGPRIHALNIARLSAETTNWEVFLRAHLNIMNDRFARVSDGSYAQAGRQTYIRELEVLDINVLDLLLGISLRIENPSQNHYFGDIARLGRALSETNKPRETEARMLEIISDDELDDYNRMVIYYLFLNYNNSLQDEGRKLTNNKLLKSAVGKLPVYLSSRLLAVE